MEKPHGADKKQPLPVNDHKFVSQPSIEASNGIDPAKLLKCRGNHDSASASPFKRIWKMWRTAPPSTDEDTPEQRPFENLDVEAADKADELAKDAFDLNMNYNCQSFEGDNRGASAAEQELLEKVRRVSDNKDDTTTAPIVVPMQCEPSKEVDLLEEIEVLRQKIKEQERINSNVGEYAKITEERSTLTMKHEECQKRLKSMVLLAAKKVKDFDDVLCQVASKCALLGSLKRERVLIDAVRNHALARLASETAEIYNALAQTESAFADLHVLYERTKTVMNKAKDENTQCEAAIKELRAIIEEKDAEFNGVQEIAELKKQQSRIAFNELRAAHAKEKERITAKLRAAQLKERLLTSELEQKSRGNVDLATLMNDLSNVEN